MQTININNVNLRGAKTLAENGLSRVMLLSNGNVLKIFDPNFLYLARLTGDDVESKILASKPINGSPEILTPMMAVYNGHQFIGYIMPRARGINYNERDDKLTLKQREDLKGYGVLHSKLESILKRNPDIVFPDFCTCDNIFITDKGKIQLIDYDGLQVGKYKSSSLSTSIGTITDYISNPKYYTSEGLFTKELDKKSSIILYFLSTFNIDLGRLGTILPSTGKPITLEDMLSIINLDDPDICHKVWKLFQEKEPNEFLGEDVLRIAEKYNLNVLVNYKGFCIKKLSKKR